MGDFWGGAYVGQGWSQIPPSTRQRRGDAAPPIQRLERKEEAGLRRARGGASSGPLNLEFSEAQP